MPTLSTLKHRTSIDRESPVIHPETVECGRRYRVVNLLLKSRGILGSTHARLVFKATRFRVDTKRCSGEIDSFLIDRPGRRILQRSGVRKSKCTCEHLLIDHVFANLGRWKANPSFPKSGRVPHTQREAECRASHTLSSFESEIESHGRVKQAGQEWTTETRWSPGTFRSETRSLNPLDPQLNDTIFFSKKNIADTSDRNTGKYTCPDQIRLIKELCITNRLCRGLQ